jgi:hypothetical protein
VCAADIYELQNAAKEAIKRRNKKRMDLAVRLMGGMMNLAVTFLTL